MPTQPKGRVSRERILKAARTVFARNPYASASLRAIGKEGGFDPPLIHYYFSTKADLFDAVLQELLAELYEKQLAWYEGLDMSRPGDALAVFLGRVFDYYVEHTEPFRILFINMAVLDGTQDVPGLARIPGIFGAMAAMLRERAPLLSGTTEEIAFFVHTFVNFLLLYLGSAPCKGLVLKMDPLGPEYRRWVIEAMSYLFLPLIEKELSPQ